MSKLILLVLSVGLMIWCSSVALRSMGPGAEVAFDALLFDAERVERLDGFVRKGDGHDVALRFVTDSSWVGALPYHGFQQQPCEGARDHIHFSITKVAAWPPWRPEALSEVACFRRTGQNKWSPDARDYLLAETRGG